eukprot:GAHX01002099.1.p1 GENE.GAHX01002099.1~~GAHX01002099.1.p1  ORF type:complete len:70 (-),score=12.30 GAHX01002099.1:12-221(-)
MKTDCLDILYSELVVVLYNQHKINEQLHLITKQLTKLRNNLIRLRSLNKQLNGLMHRLLILSTSVVKQK